MSGCVVAKLCLGLSVITTIIYAIAFASPHWIRKDFTIGVPGYMLGIPFPFNTSTIPVQVSSNMGLLASCDDITVNIPGFPTKNTVDCGSDGAKDWQYAAAGCGIAGLVLGVLSIGLATTVVFLDSWSHYNKLRVATFFCYLLACGSIIVPIILYATKKEFQVKPPLPDKVDFDFYWAIWVAVGTDATYCVLAILQLVQLITTSADKEPPKDASSSYRMDYEVPSS